MLGDLPEGDIAEGTVEVVLLVEDLQLKFGLVEGVYLYNHGYLRGA